MPALLYLIILISIIGQCGSPIARSIYHVRVSGSDINGDGSPGSPWRTLEFALANVPAGKGYTIQLSAGRFIEHAFLQVPPGINIKGEGKNATLLVGGPSLQFPSPDWHFDKFLLSLVSTANDEGYQTLQDLSIDGSEKKLYGGILVKGRTNVLLKNLRIENMFFTGIWFWNTRHSRITEVEARNNAFGNSGGASASILLSDSEHLEVDHLDIDEAFGQALEVVSGKMHYLKLHHNRFSVSPEGNWRTPSGQLVPNLAVEFFNADLKNCKVFNNYFDNNLSLVMGEEEFKTPSGSQTVRVYNNFFDLTTRAGGHGHAIELTVHNVEIDHNHIRGGLAGIANWGNPNNSYPQQNWKIHHNTFYGIKDIYPSAIIALFRGGVTNAHIYNNTVELYGEATVNFIEVNNGGVADNVRLDNNLVIDGNTSYKWHPNRFISVLGKARFINSSAQNNFLQRMRLDEIPGVSYSGNLSGYAQIRKKGKRPRPYYEPAPGSPLIDRGLDLQFEYAGKAPEIGAVEYEENL